MRAFVTLVFVVLVAGCASAPIAEITRLAASDSVQGSAIGYAGTEGEFSASFRRFYRRASDAQIREMITHSRPAVRLMGFVVALHRWPPARVDIIEKARLDVGEVTFHYGCDLLGEKRTVASLVIDEMLWIDEPVTPLLRKKEPSIRFEVRQ